MINKCKANLLRLEQLLEEVLHLLPQLHLLPEGTSLEINRLEWKQGIKEGMNGIFRADPNQIADARATVDKVDFITDYPKRRA